MLIVWRLQAWRGQQGCVGCAQMGASASLRLPIASEAARSRHALMPAAAPARRSAAAAAAALYPRFDASPAPPIDFVRAPPAAGLWPPRCVHACLSQSLSAPTHTRCEIFVRCMGRVGQHSILSAACKDEAKQSRLTVLGIRPPSPLSVKRCASRAAGVPAGGGGAAAGRLAHGQLPEPAAAAGGRPGVRGGAAGAGAPAAAAGAGAGAARGGGAALGLGRAARQCGPSSGMAHRRGTGRRAEAMSCELGDAHRWQCFGVLSRQDKRLQRGSEVFEHPRGDAPAAASARRCRACPHRRSRWRRARRAATRTASPRCRRWARTRRAASPRPRRASARCTCRSRSWRSSCSARPGRRGAAP
jgi:hypothetical protein